MKVIAGYPGGNDVNRAMERGEVQAGCGWRFLFPVNVKPLQSNMSIFIQGLPQRHSARDLLANKSLLAGEIL
jgi:hypothetical protein